MYTGTFEGLTYHDFGVYVYIYICIITNFGDFLITGHGTVALLTGHMRPPVVGVTYVRPVRETLQVGL